MKNIQKIGVSLVLVIAVSVLGSAQVVYKRMGVKGAGQNFATAINNSGQVVINTGTATSSNVSLWNWSSGFSDLGLANIGANGLAVNNSGLVVGAGTPSGSLNQEGFVYQSNSGLQWLGSLGSGMSMANSVNNSGTAVGLSYTADFFQHAFLWTQGGGMQDITPDVISVGGVTAMGINSSNQVVGYYFPNGATDTVGFSWTQSGGRQDIGPAGTLALAVNDAGTIVGSSPNANGFRHAFIWTPTKGMKDLGTLGGSQSTALSVNSKGWVVGTSMTSTGNGLLHGFLWTPTGGMKDLVTVAGLGKALQPVSVQINDFGVIAVSTNNSVTTLIPIMDLTVASSVNPSKVGKPVTFTATMSSFAGAPPNGDIVTFQSGSQILGTATLTNGVAQLTTTALTVGTRTIVVKFPGDPNYLPAKSPALTQIVTN